MKNRILSMDIGTIGLAEIEIMTDCIELFIPITSVSENLKVTIEENIQKAKEKHQKEYLDYNGLKWSDNRICIENKSLYIASDGNEFTYKLCFDFNDMENDLIETGFEIKVDLSEHEEELKKLIISALIDKFF